MIFSDQQAGRAKIFQNIPQQDFDMTMAKLASLEENYIPKDADKLVRDIMEGALNETSDVEEYIRTNIKNMGSSDFAGQRYVADRTEKIASGAAFEEAAQRITRVASGMNMSKIALIGAATLGVAAFLGGSGPRIDQEPAQGRPDRAPSSDGQYMDPSFWSGGPPGTEPKAYLQQRGTGYERVNMRVNGKSNINYTNDQISQIISDEIMFQSPMDLNISIYSKDDRKNLDKQWLRGEMLRALAH